MNRFIKPIFFRCEDQDTQALKEHLIDELDYVLVPTEAWNKLISWYSCLDGQRPIVRKVRQANTFERIFFPFKIRLLNVSLFLQVIEHGMFVKHCKVEVYLLELNLCENNNMDIAVTRYFSKADTIGEEPIAR